MSGLEANVIFEPGFFSNSPVQLALLAGGVVALMSGVVGVFTVVRGQSFAGHSFADMDTTGGAGAFLLGVGALWGFLAVAVAAAGAMEVLGVERRRGRDVATGVVLGAALGLAALFLFWDTTVSSTTGATTTILFGSLFTIGGSTVPTIVALSVAVLAATLVLYRPLLFSSLNADMARVRGVRVRLVSAAFMLMMALAVALSAIAVGAVLSTALLIGPAATALRLTKRPGVAMVVSAGVGLIGVWLGILFAYDSSAWPGHHGWPVSFSVVAVIFVFYLVADLGGWVRAKHLRVRQVRLAARGGMMFSGFMMNAWIVATIAAVVAGVVGFFVVVRGSAFVAHALPQSAFTGAAAAYLIGINALFGMGAFALASALGIAWLGKRGRHDVVTALTLVMLLGLGELFLSYSTEYAQAIYSLLFGEVLGVSSNQIIPTAILATLAILAVAVMYRPLMLTSVLPEIGETRGVRSYRMEMAFLIVVALATTAAVPVVGALLMFSLMIGPPAASRCFTDKPAVAIALSVALALMTVWASIAIAYERNWPVGFLVGTIGALVYMVGRAWAAWGRGRVGIRRSLQPTPA